MAKNKKADNQVSAVRRAKHGWVLTVFFSILAVLWLYPIFLVAMNSLKKKGFITRYPFALPDHRSFFGIENFIKGVQKTNFFAAMGNSVIITVGSVAVITVSYTHLFLPMRKNRRKRNSRQGGEVYDRRDRDCLLYTSRCV